MNRDRPLVLYDAECGVCRWLLAGLLSWDRAARLRPLGLQTPEAIELLSDLSPEERMSSWHLIAPDGERESGGTALAPLLRYLPGGGVPAAVVGRFPGLAERGYRWIADHRSQISKLIPQRSKQRAAESVRRREEQMAAAASRDPR